MYFAALVGAFEWLYDTFPEPGQFTVPTEAPRNGDFSALLAQGILIYDPLTGQPFPGNVIPANRINPISRGLLDALVLPTLPGYQDNYYARDNYESTLHKIDTKMTWTPGNKLNLNNRLSWLTSRQNSHGIFPWFSDETPILWYAPHERFVLFPEKIHISRSEPATDHNRLNGKVLDLGYFGKDSLYRVELGNGAIIRVNHVNERRGHESDRVAQWSDNVWLTFAPASAILLKD